MGPGKITKIGRIVMLIIGMLTALVITATAEQSNKLSYMKTWAAACGF